MEDSTVLEVVGQLNSASGTVQASRVTANPASPSNADLNQRYSRNNSKDSQIISRTEENGKEERFLKPEQFVAVVAGLQFAVVILIAQRRIPFANDAEFFVVLAMLMITAAHHKIIEFLPDGSRIHNNGDAILFVVLVIPVFAFMIVIELWFVALLFSYDPQVDLAALGDNASKILSIGKFFGIAKVLLVPSIVLGPRILRQCRHLKK